MPHFLVYFVGRGFTALLEALSLLRDIILDPFAEEHVQFLVGVVIERRVETQELAVFALGCLSDLLVLHNEFLPVVHSAHL